MESIIALIKGMGIFHLRNGGKRNDRCEPAGAVVSAISRKFETFAVATNWFRPDYCQISLKRV